MKTPLFMLYMTGIILLLTITVPVAAEMSTITSISPSGSLTGTITTVTITGTDFNTSSVNVRLMKDNVNITATSIISHSSTSIKCKFSIDSDESIGIWDVVVVNKDLSEVVDEGAFTIGKTMTLTSISPESAKTNDDITVTVVGTGLSEVENMYLYNVDYDNITADIISQTSTKVIGAFDLYDADIDNYDICVEDSVGTIKCGLDFEIVTDEVGSIEVVSSPSGAKIYVDSVYMGTTPYTIEDVSLGSHKILISKTGYDDWSKWVTVKLDATTTVNADLYAIQTTTVTTAALTTVKTPLKASTIKVPTPWPTDTPTQASSLEPFVILVAVGTGFVILRKH
jgi:hypothetical protein